MNLELHQKTENERLGLFLMNLFRRMRENPPEGTLEDAISDTLEDQGFTVRLVHKDEAAALDEFLVRVPSADIAAARKRLCITLEDQ